MSHPGGLWGAGPGCGLASAICIALFMLCATLAPGAGAQTLDIRPTESPASAGAAGAIARADLLDDLDQLAIRLEAADPSPRDAARAALRRYTLLMLPEAPRDGGGTGDGGGRAGDPEPPPAVALLGRTLWRLMGQLDEAIADAGVGAAEHLHLLLARAAAPLSADEAERALRDALAPLAQQAAGAEDVVGGWFDADPRARPGGELAAPLDIHFDLLESGGAHRATIEQLGVLEELLSEADRWRGYRRSAATIRAQVRLAANALAIDYPWLDDITRAALADAWADAIRRLADERQDAALQVELLAGVAGALELLEIADSLGGGRWDRTRAAAQAAIAHDPTMRSGQLREGAAMLARVARLAGAAPVADPLTERSVIRQLRPAWRTLSRQREQAVDDLSAVAPDLLGGGRAITDPGALAAVAALEQAAADLGGLLLISGAIADPETPEGREPQVHRDHRLTAARLLRHGQALQSGDGASGALAELRQFGAILRARRDAPSSEWLARRPEAVQEAWREIAGGRAGELLEADARALQTWLRLWPDTTDATRLREIEQRLRAHELLLAPLRDLAEVSALAAASRPAVDDAALQLRLAAPGRAPVWPGWELSPVALDALLARAEARLADAVTMALDRRGAGPAGRAAAVGEDLAPLRLVAALERRLGDVGGATGSAPLDEIWLGPPLPGSHGRGQRAALAAAALALEDWALSPEADDALWPRAVRLAAGALREMGRDDRGLGGGR